MFVPVVCPGRSVMFVPVGLSALEEQLQCTSSSLVARTNIVCFISVAVYPLLPIIAPAVFLVLGEKTKEAP